MRTRPYSSCCGLTDRRPAASALTAMLYHGVTPPDGKSRWRAERALAADLRNYSRSAAAAPCWAASLQSREGRVVDDLAASTLKRATLQLAHHERGVGTWFRVVELEVPGRLEAEPWGVRGTAQNHHDQLP